MFLKHRISGDQLRVEDLEALFDARQSEVEARDQAGQEEQDPQNYPKSELIFPSGEALPRCWSDPEYRCDASIGARNFARDTAR